MYLKSPKDIIEPKSDEDSTTYTEFTFHQFFTLQKYVSTGIVYTGLSDNKSKCIIRFGQICLKFLFYFIFRVQPVNRIVVESHYLRKPNLYINQIKFTQLLSLYRELISGIVTPVLLDCKCEEKEN